jgi:hypothetical protein
MRPLTPIELTPSAGSRGARVAVLTLLFTALAAPPALAQGGGITAPHSGGIPAPDPAPTPAEPAPDAAPGADSEGVAPAPSPGPAPAPATPPDTTFSAPEGSTATPAAPQSAGPGAGQRQPRRSHKGATRSKARDKRKAAQRDRRSTVERASPASVFGVNRQLVGGAASDADVESPPVELIAWGLLTLVLAAAALLTLTARLSRMEGLTAPMRHDAKWLQRVLQASRLPLRGTRGRPAS